MAFVHGKNSYFAVDDNGGVLRNISQFTTEVNMPREIDMAETSAFGNEYKTFIQGLSNATISISGRWDSTATTGPDAVLSSIMAATQPSTFEYAPEGNGATTNVMYTAEVWMSSYEVTSSIGDVVSFSASFQLAEDLTRDTIANSVLV